MLNGKTRHQIRTQQKGIEKVSDIPERAQRSCGVWGQPIRLFDATVLLDMKPKHRNFGLCSLLGNGLRFESNEPTTSRY